MSNIRPNVIGDKALIEVLKKRPAHRRPIWFMRQAGRYLPEYRRLREKAGSFLDLCYNPELACEVTLQPLRRYDLDAAILFADILVVPHAMGVDLAFSEGEGPVLGIVRSMLDVNRLRSVRDRIETKRICETVEAIRARLVPGKALIGFCGGPWTVASYMVAGGGSDRVLARIAAYQREPWFITLIERLVEESVCYLSAQIRAGAEVVQIFDSWAGDLVGSEREDFVNRPIEMMVMKLQQEHPEVPIIVFARGVGVGHERIAGMKGVSAIGVETEFDLKALDPEVVVQGNLDPVCLLAGVEVAQRESLRICEGVNRGRHIFNLGHGIRVGTDPDVLSVVIDSVRSMDE
jgi:uroporphyrinogen decarboxylase